MTTTRQHPTISTIQVTLRFLSFIEEEFDTEDITEQQFDGKYAPISQFFVESKDIDCGKASSSCTRVVEQNHREEMQPDMLGFYRILFPRKRQVEHLGGLCFDFDEQSWCYSKMSETVPSTMDNVQFMSHWITVLDYVLNQPTTTTVVTERTFDFSIYGENFQIVVRCCEPTSTVSSDDHPSDNLSGSRERSRFLPQGTVEFRHLGYGASRLTNNEWMKEDEFDPHFNPAPRVTSLQQFVTETVRELNYFYRMITLGISCGHLNSERQILGLNRELLTQISNVINQFHKCATTTP